MPGVVSQTPHNGVKAEAQGLRDPARIMPRREAGECRLVGICQAGAAFLGLLAWLFHEGPSPSLYRCSTGGPDAKSAATTRRGFVILLHQNQKLSVNTTTILLWD